MTVDGSNGDNVIDVVGAGSSVTVLGLTATTSISGSEGANDRLVVRPAAARTRITATTLPAGVIQLTLDGGAGNDTILGSQGADTVLGGDGNDFVFGDNGNDVAFMGAGNDVFQWNPGDGNDTIEGQDGSDTMLFFGANVSENIDIVGQRRPRAVPAQRRERDDGPQRRGEHRLPRARRRRQHRDRRPERHRREPGQRSTCAAPTAAATAQPTT